jgi:formylmethanofuran dehydrogenase subunit E
MKLKCKNDCESEEFMVELLTKVDWIVNNDGEVLYDAYVRYPVETPNSNHLYLCNECGEQV